MNEFIYSIEDIFNKVLNDRKIEDYYIPPYQRGYKWDCCSRYDQVPQMLIDVYYAFMQKTDEYYLQYITVKKVKIHDAFHFEVIDGQQRLTTISLMLYRFYKDSPDGNIAKDKVSYSRYTTNVFDWVNKEIYHIDDSSIDSQDKWYMIRAAKCIDKFYSILGLNNQCYIDYFLNHVKIILNEESEFVSSEETFANLNDNKVQLTNAYLIKGVLLTLSARYVNNNGLHRTYKEIMDQRTIMGRTWDEILAWISQPKVAHYFFGVESNGMEHLLSLIDLPSQDKGTAVEKTIGAFSNFFQSTAQYENELELFNRFNENIKDDKAANEVLQKLKHIYRKLRSVYDNFENCSLYNKMGYVMFCKDPVDRTVFLTDYINLSPSDFQVKLKDELLRTTPTLSATNKTDFRYKAPNPKLTNLLLSLSVFPEVENPSYRFDFYQYDKEEWSFEHIFPQHPPKNKIKIADVAYEVVLRAIKNHFSAELKAHKGQPDFRDKCKEYYDVIIAYRAQRKEKNGRIDPNNLFFLYSGLDDEHEHCCGNMALISGGANSALSNNPYIAKRLILQMKEQEGYFIPRHTKEIFNKMISCAGNKAVNPDLLVWNEHDVDAHLEWMIKRNDEIRKNF